MQYKIIERDVIKGVGVTKNFRKFKIDKQAENWNERMGDVWSFWHEFLNNGANLILRDKYNLYKAPLWQMGVNYTDENGNLIVSIGAEDDGGDYPELAHFQIPASTWAVFSAKGTLHQNEHPLDALTTRIFSEWFPSSGYEQSMNYQIEVYGPGDTGSDDYTCDIWIPIQKK